MNSSKNEKVQKVHDIYSEYIKNMLGDNETFNKYLRISSDLYRYSFANQIIIAAQRENVTSCVSLKKWNQLGYYVNKGAKGIMLLDRIHNNEQIRYVFDYNDVHLARNTKPQNIGKWSFENSTIEKVEEVLSKEYSEEWNAADDFDKNIHSVIESYVDEYIDYLHNEQLSMFGTNDNRLTEEEEKEFGLIVEIIFQNLQERFYGEEISIKYPEINISNVNRLEMFCNVISSAQKDIFTAFEQISRNLEKTLESTENIGYNALKRKSEEKQEEFQDDGNNIQTGRGYTPSEPRMGRGGTDGGIDEIRKRSLGLSGAEEPGAVSSVIQNGGIEETLSADTNRSDGDGGKTDKGDSTERGHNRNDESIGSDRMGKSNEQYQIQSDGDSDERADKSLEDLSEIRTTPYIFCEWSESGKFQSGKTYSIYEFDKLMKQADDEFIEGRKAGLERYGTSQKWKEENETEYFKFLGYDKIKFTIVLPDGRRISERQDAGDGIGGLIDFLKLYEEFNDVIPILQDTINEEIKTIEAEANELPLFASENQNDKFKSQNSITHFKLNEDAGKGLPADRARMNLEALELLIRLESEDRDATEEEKSTLSNYSGWGGLSNVFNPNERYGYEKETREKLQRLLSADEYSAAEASTLDAYYTPGSVIDAIYGALESFGFEGGRILEPSCGIGNFFGRLPDKMTESELTGIELDSITGRIAKKLYPEAQITISGFENVALRDNSFDVAIGNVPFGEYSLFDPDYQKYHFMIHDYFFAKSLDKVREGGIVAFITTRGTLDKRDDRLRKYIGSKAAFLGAVRLPNNVFQGTQVVSDIIFLQKRDRSLESYDSEEWMRTSQYENKFDDKKIYVNEYFLKHPEMVLGELSLRSGQHGTVLTCYPQDSPYKIKEQLQEALKNIKAEIKEAPAFTLLDNETEENYIQADSSIRPYSFIIIDDTVFFKEAELMKPVELSAAKEKRVRGLIEIRDILRQLIDCEMNDGTDEEAEKIRIKLNSIYDTFAYKYGRITSKENTNVFIQDASYYLLASLENLDEGKFKSKADIFTKRTIRPKTNIEKVETASEALAVSLNIKGFVDMPYMMSLCGKSEEEIREALPNVIFKDYNFSNGEHRYVTADEFLSGNVREKMESYEFALMKLSETSDSINKERKHEFEVNISALKKSLPKQLTAAEIEVRLGATWIPVEYLNQFMYETFGTGRWDQEYIKVSYSEIADVYNVSSKSRGTFDNVTVNHTYGTSRRNAYYIFEACLNQKDIKIFDTQTIDGKEKQIFNKKETILVQQKQEIIREKFKEWLYDDPDRREDICNIYNRKFNSIRAREYDGSHLTFPSMNPEIELKDYQKNAVARGIYGGNTLLAHVVGAGKTFEMAAIAMEGKRLGISKKNLFVVPNHLTGQWAAEFYNLYPGANILVATKKDFEPGNRKRFCARIATGDYDAIIIGASQFEKIPVSDETQQDFLRKQIKGITDAIANLQAQREEKFSVRQMQITKKSLEKKLNQLLDGTKKDDVVTFEELGVDRIFIDEAHNYKNLFLYTKMQNVAGISQTDAKKSSDLYMKCQYLDKMTNGKGIVFATGTPVSNSMAEIYTMMRYLQSDTLEKLNLSHFDAWASTFGETTTALELAPEGTKYRTKTRFSRFYNLPELMTIFRETADIKTVEDLALPRPQAEYVDVVSEASEIQKDIIRNLGERADKVRNGNVEPYEDNMLKITTEGRKIALDQRLSNPLLPDFENSKVNRCAENIFEIYKGTQTDKSTQIIFCDQSVSKGDGMFNVYDALRDKLVAKGIPKDEIAFVQECKNEKEKDNLFAKVRSGKVRILVGSTSTMGTGTNVQKRLIALHHLDVPWRPSDIEQQEGRILRQGNMNPNVKIFRYITKGTFDAYSWQLIEQKQRFSSQIMSSKSPVRSCDDIDAASLSFAEVKMLATENPYIKEKMEMDVKVAKLKLLRSDFMSRKYNLEDRIKNYFPKRIAEFKEKLYAMERDAQKLEENESGSNFEIEIMGSEFDNREAAGQGLIAALQKNHIEPRRYFSIGKYKGFELEAMFEPDVIKYNGRIKGNAVYNFEFGVDAIGNIRRIENAAERIIEMVEIQKEKIADAEHQLKVSIEEVKKPFDMQEEYEKSSARLKEIDILLNLDSKEEPVMSMGDEADNIEINNKDKIAIER